MIDEKEPMSDEVQKVRFYYPKSPAFSTLHVDGAIGGVTPRGLIHMACFSERFAIPQETVVELHDGSVKQELLNERVGKEGIVRELVVDLVFDRETALLLRNWLTDQLETLQRIEAVRPANQSK